MTQLQVEAKEKMLERAVEDDSVERVADVLHYLVVHAGIKQYYYELKFIRSGAKLLELIGRALRNLELLRRDKEYEDEIKKLWTPSKEDEATTLKYYNALKTDFIKALSGLVLGSCRFCWEKRKGEG